MKIGIAGPASLHLLKPSLENPEGLPRGYEFPQTSLIIEQLLEFGHEVSLFTLDNTTTFPRVFKGHKLTLHVGRYRPRHRARDFFAVERADLINSMKTARCDVIHAHWTYEFALAALDSGTPSLITLRDWAPTILRLKRDPYRFVRWLMQRRTLHRGRQFTVTSPYLQEKLRRTTGQTAPIIPNGLSSSLFAKRDRLPHTGHPILVSVNNGFGNRKNVQTLLRAFAIVRQSIKSAQLWLIGAEYGDGEVAQRWAEQRRLIGGVHFLGRMEYNDVIRHLSMAHVLVHPSLEESFGMTLVEAMSQGTPVVGGVHSGAVPWVTGDGQAGVLVDVRSPEAIANTIMVLLDQPHLWRKQSRAGLARAAEYFSLKRVVEKYQDEYERILDA